MKQVNLCAFRSILRWYKKEVMSREWTSDSSRTLEAIDCLIRTMPEDWNDTNRKDD
jgi:hypothetical protein